MSPTTCPSTASISSDSDLTTLVWNVIMPCLDELGGLFCPLLCLPFHCPYNGQEGLSRTWTSQVPEVSSCCYSWIPKDSDPTRAPFVFPSHSSLLGFLASCCLQPPKPAPALLPVKVPHTQLTFTYLTSVHAWVSIHIFSGKLLMTSPKQGGPYVAFF